MTALWQALEQKQLEWIDRGLVFLSVPVDGPDEGKVVATGSHGMRAVGRSPRMAIEALKGAPS